ncbi:hypothetical protein ACFQ9V_07855 [Leifsonia sp. NPDC056665]|uniref:hypothetical protein n=1 Tax=Leifsonia sp. NPDC056665 TaxID=3345901 RepID=UPI0036AEBB04
MNSIPTSPADTPRRPARAELADFADRLRGQLGGLPGFGQYPGTIATLDAGHLAHTLGTGADLTLPSAVATGDVLFAPDLNPAFFYSWDVHPTQQPDWFRVSVRFTPSDFGITETRSYDLAWAVVPFILDLGAVLTVEASANAGVGAATWTLDAFQVRTLHVGVGPIGPDETVHVDLVRGSGTGSWIWLHTVVGDPPLTTEP